GRAEYHDARQPFGETWARPQRTRAGRREQRGESKVRERQFIAALLQQRALVEMGRSGDHHRARDRDRAERKANSRGGEAAPPHFRHARERGIAPAGRQSDLVDPGAGGVEARASEGAEEFLRAVYGEVTAEDETPTEECDVAHRSVSSLLAVTACYAAR